MAAKGAATAESMSSEHGDGSELDPAEEINVDDSDAERSCEEGASSPSPRPTRLPGDRAEPAGLHPFSISRLLAADELEPPGPEEARCDEAEAAFNQAHLLAPFRLLPGASGFLYANGVIRVPAHRPQGALLPPWGTLPPSAQQQAAAAAAASAGLHTARFLANLAAHPLQGHPHLKDRLAGENKINVDFLWTVTNMAPKRGTFFSREKSR